MSYSLFISTLSLAGGLLIFFMGLVILRENARSAVNRATALMLFSGALGCILGAIGELIDIKGAPESAAVYAGYLKTFSSLWEFFFPSLLYFSLVFPLQHPIVRRRHVAEVALYIPHVFHLALVLLLAGTDRFTQPLDVLLQRLGPSGLTDFLATMLELIDVLVALMNKVHQQFFSLVNLAYAAVAISLLHLNRRRVAISRVRMQLAIVLLGLTLCMIAYIAAIFLSMFFPYQDFASAETALISMALLVASGSIAYAIVRYKFLDMQNLARRSILYGGTALMFAILYLLVVKQVTRLSASIFGQNVEIIEAGFIVLSVIVFQPVLTSLEDLIENLMRKRDKSDVQVVIGDLSRQLAAEVDLRGIRERLAQRLKASFLVQQVRLLTLEERADGWVLDRGDAHLPMVEGSAVENFLDYFRAAPQPVMRQDLERAVQRLASGERETVHDWITEYQLLVPLVHQGQIRGLLALGPKLTGGRFHAEDMALLSVLAQQITTSIENVRLLSENVQKRILEEEISLASEIQRGLLPKQFPQRPGYRTHAVSYASKFVGGDYFDLFSLDGKRFHLAIADVSGKGVSAALLMSSLRAALRSNVAHLDSPAQVLTRINNLLYESTSPEKFATFFYGILDTESHELVYANAGHNYPIVVTADRTTEELKEGGLLLGAFPNVQYQDSRRLLGEGDVLFMYTDGVTEATCDGDEDYGEERLQAYLLQRADSGPQEIVLGVLEEVREFTHGAEPADDVTMLVIRRLANGSAPVGVIGGERP